MVYTIAAYSITVGVLALYGVLLQHRARVAAADLLAATTTTTATAAATQAPLSTQTKRGVNVGAALLAPLWMWAHGLRLPGLLIGLATVAVVPLALRASQNDAWLPAVLVAVIPIAAGTALAISGDRIAAEHRGISDPAVLSATQLPWALIGITLYVFVLPWVFYFA